MNKEITNYIFQRKGETLMRLLIAGLLGTVATVLVLIFIVYVKISRKKLSYFTIKSCKIRLIFIFLMGLCFIVSGILLYDEIFNCVITVVSGVIWLLVFRCCMKELTELKEEKIEKDREELINKFKGDVPIIDAEYREIDS